MNRSRPQARLRAKLAAIVAGFLVGTLTPASAVAFPNPVLRGVADPGVLRTEAPQSNRYHVASTSSVEATNPPCGKGALPVWSTPLNPSDFSSWSCTGFILRRLPSWIATTEHGKRTFIWAPQVYLFKNLDRYVAYYAALNKSGKRCIGRAISPRLAGAEHAPPNDFTDRGFGRAREPLCNPNRAYGLIDPALFTLRPDQPGMRRFLLYKRDRDGRTTCPKRGKLDEIVIRSVDPNDGAAPLGTPRVLLTPRCDTWEARGAHPSRKKGTGRPSVEAPTMVFNPATGYYYLFYSGNSFLRDRYAIGVARSRRLEGPFERHPDNPILSAEEDPQFCGTGHQDVIPPNALDNRWLMFYHAYTAQRRETRTGGELCEGGRSLMVDELEWRPDAWPVVKGGKKPSREPPQPTSASGNAN